MANIGAHRDAKLYAALVKSGSYLLHGYWKNWKVASLCRQYAISQLRIVCSGLQLVAYLDVGNFCDKRTETTLHEICVQGFLRFSNSNKTSQSVSLIYELA